MIALKPPRGLSHLPRRALLLASAALLSLVLLPAMAQADTSSTLTVVGTSDVSDSGLIPNLIQPGFTAAYPQYTFKYIGTATGTAITDAETGSVGASVLIVHAASLENQFVAGGYSYEQYGRALFTNDFVLGGPSGDPAGVKANGASNMVQAFADIAAAGAGGGASPPVTFVSRGGTPGTTVEEHQIWADVASSGLAPAGLTLCTLNSTVGGGETPVTASTVTNSGDPCPSSGALPPAGDLPPWYAATGLTQGPNVVDANNCASFHSPANSCYVLTDRGTFDYLSSGTDPAGSIPNLSILTHGPQAATAPGGTYLLTNYFHGYIINPSQTVLGGSTPEPVNLPAAQAFLNYLTSPAVQSELKTYLANSDTLGPPFVADASPTLTLTTGFPATANAGTPVTVAGTLANAEPGYPLLAAGQPVNVDEIVGGLDIKVGSGTTTASGSFSIPFTPPASGTYQVTTNQIAQIENPNLSPVFGDLLSPASTQPVSMSVQGAVSVSSAKGTPTGVTVTGTVAPGAPDGNATVSVLARPASSGGLSTTVGTTTLATGNTAYAATGKLAPGTWQIVVTYQDPGQFLAAKSNTVTVTVPKTGSKHTVSFKKVTVKKGKLTLTGTLKPAPTASGAKIELLTLRVGKTSIKKGVRAGAAKATFHPTASTTVGKGKTSFTIRAKLKRGSVYKLELEYVQRGQTSSFSKLRSLAVH
jgi:tungstate transport system substrate-binding protein